MNQWPKQRGNQVRMKMRISKNAFVWVIGIWKLEFVWNLGFVIWYFISYYRLLLTFNPMP